VVLKILPPENLSPTPDEATRTGLSDYTGGSADKRVLHINFGIFKYGTDDKAHAAALVFALILLIALLGIVVAGFNTENAAWADKCFGWLGSAFLFVAGVALGKGSAKKSED
jgi:hypothetical protein